MKALALPTVLVSSLVTSLLLLAGCGGDGGGTQADTSPTVPVTPASTYIAGTITTASGAALSGVTLQISNAANATSNTQGYYYVGGLDASTRSVLPSLAGSGFSPCYQIVTPTAAKTNFTQVPVSRKLHGLSFGAYGPNEGPTKNTTPTEDFIRLRLSGLVPYTETVSLYGIADKPSYLPMAASIAHQLGLKVHAIAWLGKDTAANTANINALIQAINAGTVDLAVVGCETLQRGDLSLSQLYHYILQVRNGSTIKVPVTTYETSGGIIANPALATYCDLVCATIYPFWAKINVNDATTYFNSQYMQVKAVAGSKTVEIAETGWPSAGSSLGAARPSDANAAHYLKSVLSWSELTGIKVTTFQSYNEAWKATAAGGADFDQSWGLLTETGTLKPGIAAVLGGDRFAGIATAGIPTITATTSPAKGSSDGTVSGTVTGVNPQKHVILMFIKVGTGWWTKPTFDQPKTFISYDGRYTNKVFTGGNDSSCSTIALYVVPADLTVVTLSGASSIPSTVTSKAVASLTITR